MVACATVDKDVEIDSNLMKKIKDNELGLKCVSFGWTSSKCTTNAIRINYFKKEDLRHEALKGVNACNKLEHEHEEASVKEMLKMQE